MRRFSSIGALPKTVSTVLLLSLLASSLAQAHIGLLDPVARTSDTGLTLEPCGGKPAGASVATYTAGTDIEITVNMPVRHTRNIQAAISYDNFASSTKLAMLPTTAAGIHLMTVPLPAQPLGSAILQVTHGNYVSCADITLEAGPAFTINAGLNDAWFDAATAGQGFFIIVFPDIGQVFLSWFTYDTERPPQDALAILGEPGHRWLTAQGPFDGDTAMLDIVLTSGGVFDSADPAVENDGKYGTLSIVWHDCENATLTYNIPSLGLMGSIELKRITPDNVALCEALNSQQG